MAEQNNNNRPGGYKPTTGNTVGVSNDPTQGDYSRRQRPLPPMTSGPNAGIWPITQTPQGIPHTADNE